MVLIRLEQQAVTINIPEGFAQTTAEFTSTAIDGGLAVVTHGWNIEATDLDDLSTRWAGAIETTIKAVMLSDYTFAGVRAISETQSSVYPGGWEGDRVNEAAPPNLCLLERKHTSLRGRANRGRAYWPGLLADGDLEPNGTINGTHYALLSGVFDDLYPIMSAASIYPVILHNSETMPPTPVATVTVDIKAATQRRRLRR